MQRLDYDYDVFISHRSSDNERVARLAQKLTAQGVRVWIDLQNIPIGGHIYLAVEDGLQRSRAVLLCLTRAALDGQWVDFERATALFRDPTNSEGRFIPVLFEDCDLPDAIRAFRYIDYREETDEAVEQIVRACRAAGRTRKRSPRTERGGHSRERMRYLRDLRQGIDNILAESIHRARFIDLGIEDSPRSIRTPLIYENPEKQEDLGTVWEAYLKSQGRLLLLGDPGSGKSTYLYDLALRLIGDAATDSDAPVPFIVNLSQCPSRSTRIHSVGIGRFKFSWKPQESSIRDWLVHELGRAADISSKEAANWIETEQVVLLLDGLDEVNDESRIDFAVRLNEELLAVCPHVSVVVCSRTNEYIPIRDREDARLRLRGAAMLQPLTEADVVTYLRAAQVPGVEQAVRDDPELMRMARSPLMVSLMALAYAGALPADIRLSGSLAERRHGLMNAYVRRMLQRTARRQRGLPTDVDSAEVPETAYQYTSATIHTYLGWLAVRMSVRMKTSLAPARLFSFLMDTTASRSTDEKLACGIAVAFLVGLVALTAVAPVLSREPMLAPQVASAAFSIPLIALALHALKPDGGFVSGLVESAGFAGIAGLIGVLIAQLSRTMTALVPALGTPLIAGVVLIPTLVGVVAVIIAIDERSPIVGVVSIVALALVYLPALITPLHGVTRAIARSYLSVAQYIPGVVRAIHDPSLAPFARGGIASILFINVLIVVAVVVGVSMIADGELFGGLQSLVLGPVVWPGLISLVLKIPDRPVLLATALTAGALTGLMIGLGTRGLRELPLPFAIALAGGILLGSDGVTVLLFAAWPVLRMLQELVVDSGRYDSRLQRSSGTEQFSRPIEEFVERVVLAPSSWIVLMIGRRWPWRRRRFISFCNTSLLLRSAAGYEFYHRRLRDYFALHHLLPYLASADESRRLAAVEAAGFQGEAAVETLIDLIRDGSSNVAAAATFALGRIASAEATAGINEAARHPDSRVRAMVPTSLGSMGAADRHRLLDELVKDRDLAVLTAALRALAESRPHPERDQLKRLVMDALDRHPPSPELVKAILEAGLRFGKEWAPDWVLADSARLLERPDPDLARPCLDLLAARSYPVPALLLVPHLDSDKTRSAALTAILCCAPHEAMPYLLAEIVGDDTAQERALDALEIADKHGFESSQQWQRILALAEQLRDLKHSSRRGMFRQITYRRERRRIINRLQSEQQQLAAS